MDDVRSGEFSEAMVEIARLAAAIDASNLQTQLALASAEKLELERIGAVRQGLNVATDERAKAADVLRGELDRTAAALRKDTEQQLVALKELIFALVAAKSAEFSAVHVAAEKAIEKQETSNQLWREQANEWRGQSADREATRARENASLIATFLPREVADQQFAQFTVRVSSLEANRNNNDGANQASERRENRTQPWHLWMAGGVLTFVIACIVILANVLTTAP